MAPERRQENSVITNGNHATNGVSGVNGHGIQPLMKHPLPDIDRP